MLYPLSVPNKVRIHFVIAERVSFNLADHFPELAIQTFPVNIEQIRYLNQLTDKTPVTVEGIENAMRFDRYEHAESFMFNYPIEGQYMIEKVFTVTPRPQTTP